MLRILFQNPQGLGILQSNRNMQSSKINKLKNTMLKQDIDIIGLAEVNTDWRVIPQQNTWWSITDGWFEHRRVATSINTLVSPSSRTQYGGTLLMMMNRVAYSVQSVQSDTTHLGRWSSMLLTGKNNLKCRVICAYCPCISTGPNSTYASQVVGLAQRQVFECPRTQFWTDLQAYLTQCSDAQESIIVIGDWNSDYEEVNTWMRAQGLKDIIQSRHGSSAPPPTCKRSRESPIDAIFVSNTFTCWRGGFLSFDYLEGDHRGLLCDIPIEYVLGYHMQYPNHPKARRLKTEDPRTCKKYISTLHQILSPTGVYDKIQQLYTLSQNRTLLPTDALKFEEWDQIITAAMYTAEQKCRKL
jgi:exonuclease III